MSKQSTKIHSQLYPDIADWPVYKLYRRRKEFVQAIDDATLQSLLDKYGKDIVKPMARTMYLELIRLKEDPWKSDPPNEKQFWKRVRRELSENAKHREDEQLARNKELLRRIIHRYSEEIAGDFHKKTFRFARKFLTVFFKRLLNAAAGKKHRRIWGGHELYNKMRIYGDLEKVRRCFDEGTVVVVPTHFSNLDSILIGYALDAVGGLGPPVLCPHPPSVFWLSRTKRNARCATVFAGPGNRLGIREAVNTVRETVWS
jgi:glycerol-3-phosphate O-acyltransferase